MASAMGIFIDIENGFSQINSQILKFPIFQYFDFIVWLKPNFVIPCNPLTKVRGNSLFG